MSYIRGPFTDFDPFFLATYISKEDYINNVSSDFDFPEDVTTLWFVLCYDGNSIFWSGDHSVFKTGKSAVHLAHRYSTTTNTYQFLYNGRYLTNNDDEPVSLNSLGSQFDISTTYALRGDILYGGIPYTFPTTTWNFSKITGVFDTSNFAANTFMGKQGSLTLTDDPEIFDSAPLALPVYFIPITSSSYLSGKLLTLYDIRLLPDLDGSTAQMTALSFFSRWVLGILPNDYMPINPGQWINNNSAPHRTAAIFTEKLESVNGYFYPYCTGTLTCGTCMGSCQTGTCMSDALTSQSAIPLSCESHERSKPKSRSIEIIILIVFSILTVFIFGYLGYRWYHSVKHPQMGAELAPKRPPPPPSTNVDSPYVKLYGGVA